MGGWMDGDELMDGWVEKEMFGWMFGWMDGWMKKDGDG